jgi:hypothetical protein
VTAAYTPFRATIDCEDDCDRLLQLPLPNAAEQDGYAMVESAVYRRQYGRRDALMAVRRAGRAVASHGIQPFTIEDLSNADGSKPPGHASHTDGKDVDLSVYDASGAAVWHPLCNEVGNECIPGTSYGMDVEAMAVKIGGMLDSGRVTHVFLDHEFHANLFAATDALVDTGILPSWHSNAMRAVVQHWPNHNNHIHVRFQL